MKKLLPQLMLCLFAVVTTVSALQSDDFTYTINTPDTNTVTITRYTGSGGAIDIPPSITNKTVTAIGVGAFFNITSLTHVAIPNSVTNIGDMALYGCSSLINVTLGNNVISIGNSAFENCGPSLNGPQWITIPASVTSIGDRAFFSCDGLKGVYFEGDAPSIGTLVFGTHFNFFTGRNLYMYHLPNTTGWGATFGGFPAYPTRLWNPLIQTDDGNFGVLTNDFGFNIAGIESELFKVEVCTNLIDGIWESVITSNLTSGSNHFSDPDWTNHPTLFYRISMP